MVIYGPFFGRILICFDSYKIIQNHHKSGRIMANHGEYGYIWAKDDENLWRFDIALQSMTIFGTLSIDFEILVVSDSECGIVHHGTRYRNFSVISEIFWMSKNFHCLTACLFSHIWHHILSSVFIGCSTEKKFFPKKKI